jgi:acetolactate synthase-1/2/3 large subunit
MSQDCEKYSHHVTELLADIGYTHCFFVPGGNIMHLLDSARTRMTCVPVVHEVSGAIAAEYFAEVAEVERAYALVTAGPGITNALTGVAGAYLESHECLLIGGQVKSADLARGTLRQRGIQEIDGLAVAAPVCNAALRIEQPLPDAEVVEAISAGTTDRRGPVFLEFCLDAQGAMVPITEPDVGAFHQGPPAAMVDAAAGAAEQILQRVRLAERPVLLIGGGVTRATAWSLADDLARLGLPLMTTWNGMDRVADDHPCFAGRPNTWGQRAANVLLAQSDCIIALGTRLGMQQTGFNWQEWGPGFVAQVDVDRAELNKGHPRVDLPLRADANSVLARLAATALDADRYTPWRDHCALVRRALPLLDPQNIQGDEFCSPYDLVDQLSDLLTDRDVLIPASSGSGQFVPMEVFRVKRGQRIVTNKGLASMGYGLAAAIGAAMGSGERTVLIEGDGSFSQNVQELGTVAAQQLNLKIFLLDNDGYASIRTTQRNYFGGVYLGCDTATGLGFPNWTRLAQTYDLPHLAVGAAGLRDPVVRAGLEAPGPMLFIVRVDPDQTYYPKVTSRIADDGSMVSNPIHRMYPDLPDDQWAQVYRFGSGT